MNLLIKVNASLLVCFGLGVGAIGWHANGVLQANAKREVLGNARLMMEAAMTARTYTTEEIKPLLEESLKHKFLPQSVPSYAATQSFGSLRNTYPDFSYKEATLNPTNPRDRVVEWEADLVQQLRDHPDRKELIGERTGTTGPALYLARPIRITNPQCLACHSTPAAAPASMTALYGSNNGFGWKLNETVGSQIVTVPLAVALRQADLTLQSIMTGVVATFLATLVLVNLLIYLVVLRPIKRISRIADAVSEGQRDVEHFKVSGNDEIATLNAAFNRMRRSLEKAMSMLA
jgi:HAMP domain-containing protein